MTPLLLTGKIHDTPETGTAVVLIRAVAAVIHWVRLVNDQCAVIKPLTQVFCLKKFHPTRIGRIDTAIQGFET